MLPRSETKAILRYVDNLLRSNRLNPEARTEVCEWALENGALFPGSGKDWVLPDEHKKKGTVQYSSIRRDVAMLLEKYAEARESASEKTLRTLVRLFGLSATEAELLALLIRKGKHGFLQDLFDRISNGRRRRSTFGKLDMLEICSVLTGIKLLDIMKAVQPKERLVSCGLLEVDFGGDVDITKAIRLIFQTERVFASTDALRNALAGNPQRSHLSWDDFAHIGDDRDLLETLLDRALKRGEKGINILLYGSPGTGKTEFCKTLAARLGISLYSAAESDECGGEVDRNSRLQSLRMLQAMLCHAGKAAIMLDEAEDVFGYATGTGMFAAMFSSASAVNSKVYMNRLLENNVLPVFWLTNSATAIDRAFVRRMSYCLEFSELPYSVRLRMSKDVCRQNGLHVTADELVAITKE